MCFSWQWSAGRASLLGWLVIMCPVPLTFRQRAEARSAQPVEFGCCLPGWPLCPHKIPALLGPETFSVLFPPDISTLRLVPLLSEAEILTMLGAPWGRERSTVCAVSRVHKAKYTLCTPSLYHSCWLFLILLSLPFYLFVSDLFLKISIRTFSTELPVIFYPIKLYELILP